MTRRHPQKASVVLVALSCVTVLGIAVASFLAVSNQAMLLSNRSYAKTVSRHLAEMGLESALAAFNQDTFSTWTRPDATTATQTFNIDSAHYGTTGLSATVHVRVDHYRDTRKTSPWSGLTTYSSGDFVWHQGVWYLRVTASPAKQPPSNTAFWTSAPASWSSCANYVVDNLVVSGGTAYRCTTANINQVPPNASYWTSSTAAGWDVGTAYGVNDVAFSGGTAYRCLQAHTGQQPPNTTYWLSAPVIYAEGVATLADAGATAIETQLRAVLAPAALFPNAAGSAELTYLRAGGVVDSYNSVLGTYNQTSAPFSGANPNLGSSAVVAGAKTSGNAVQITTTRINGYVAATSSTSSPYAPRWTYSASGIVTSTPAPTIPPVRRDLTRVSRSPYVPSFDIQSVAAINLLSGYSGATNLPRGGDVLSADGKYYYYTSGDLNLSSGDTLTIDESVVIDLQPGGSADLTISGSGKIVVANNATASLEIHLGDRLYVGSNSGGGIQNLTLDPKRCAIFNTSTYDSSGYHYFWSNLPYYGVVYMPYGYLHVWNSGYVEHIYGAFSASNVYFNHVANLHYDTSLRTAVFSGVDTPYEIVEWRELTDTAERISLP